MTTVLSSSKALLSAQQEANVWNLFVQILLPLIIILSFVAMLEIARYRRGFNERGVELAILEARLRGFEQTSEGQRAVAYHNHLMELQRQKLILALEAVFNEEGKAFGFDRLPNGESVRLDGSTISDDTFKALSGKLANLENSASSLEQWEKQLFQRILEKAKVLPQASRNGKGEMHNVLGTDIEQISEPNQKLLLEGITEKRNGMFRDLTIIQQEVLTRIFEAKLLADETPDPKVLEIAQRISLGSDNERNRDQAVREMLQYLNERVQESLEADGYRFLKQTWGSIQ